MGGAPCCEGNVTPAAEYNIWVDPEAASIVMRSGLPVELIGWQLCRGEAVLREDEIGHVQSLKTQACSLRHRVQQSCAEGIQNANKRRWNLACRIRSRCVSRWIPASERPGASTMSKWRPQSELTRGMTVVDRLNVAEDERNRADLARCNQRRPKAKVCWSIDNSVGSRLCTQRWARSSSIDLSVG